RSMGSSITQFRKGLKDAEIEVEDSTQLEADSEKGDASSKD
ncbi:MAG: Sec-independent protein translocase protein TatA, partial [Planctomycetota bacterium]